MIRIGHRGLAGKFTENTLEGIESAYDLGFRAFEIDVRLTADLVPVVIHDATLDRLSDCTGLVSEWRYPQLQQQCRLQGGERIPSLAELLDLSVSKAFHLYIEIKDVRAFDLVVRLLDERSQHGHVISSFFHRQLRRLKQERSDFRTMALVECDPVDPFRLLTDALADDAAFGLDSVSAETVRVLARSGVPTYGWTAHSEHDFKKAEDLGVVGVFTDIP